MSVYVDTKYRIKRNEEYDDNMRYIVQDLKIVQSMSELLVACALIGFNNRYCTPNRLRIDFYTIMIPTNDSLLRIYFFE